MESKIKLECDYCGIPITEKDYKCPNCGADCSKVVKKYKQEKEKKEEELREKGQQIQEEITQTVMNSFQTSSKIFKIVFFVIFAIIIGTFILFFTFGLRHSSVENESDNNHDNFFIKGDKQEKVSVGYNETASIKDYSIILDSYEFYAHDSEYFSSTYRTKDGYQKIAFHFILEGLSSSEVNTYFGANISLKADDYIVESAQLDTGMHEYVVSGRESYPELSGSVTEGEKLQGYLGFIVPKDAKELKFKVGDYITIIMDNPAYDGE